MVTVLAVRLTLHRSLDFLRIAKEMHPLSGLADESEFFEAILKRVTVELNLIVTLNTRDLKIKTPSPNKNPPFTF